MTIETSLRERLLKTLRLANQGVGGERANAEVILDKLLRRHGLTRADLEEIDAPKRETRWYTVSAKDKDVFYGLAQSLFGNDINTWRRQRTQQRGIDLTTAEKVTLDLAWETYRKAWKRAQSDLAVSFRMKHKLFAATGEGRSLSEFSAEELAEYRRRRALADSLEDVESPRKRIGAGV